jgi:hypothetical protein
MMVLTLEYTHVEEAKNFGVQEHLMFLQGEGGQYKRSETAK